MSSDAAVTKVDLSQYKIKKIASGKVREIFEIDDQTLLFVATDRISAYDVILNNVSIPFIYCSSRCCSMACGMR
jgi:phosphoribosylaminoimidazole-succinocarboxamide synthase